MLTSFFKKLTGGKFFFFLSTFCLLHSTNLNAQEILLQNKVIGTTPPIGYAYRYDCRGMGATSDGGYILGGYSNLRAGADKSEDPILGAFNNGYNGDYWIVKVDSNFNVLWDNTIGGDSTDYLNSIEQTTDGGFICGGYSYSNISGDKTENRKGDSDYWIVKLNSTGTIQWQKTIGGSSEETSAFSKTIILQTPDGGYICGGTSFSNISGDKTENSKGGSDYWVVKLNSTGNITWQKTIGGAGSDEFTDIELTSDGGYILIGNSVSGVSGDKTQGCFGSYDYWVVKIDNAGLIQWEKTFGGNVWEVPWSVIQTSDGGYLVGGWSPSGISGNKTEGCFGYDDFWILKLDPNGNIEWQRTLGGFNMDRVFAIAETINGDYICSGLSYSDISGTKTENNHSYIPGLYSPLGWIVALDSNGNSLWQNSIGGLSEGFYNIVITPSNDFICAGESSAYSSSYLYDINEVGSGYWICKLSGNSNLITGKNFVDLNNSGFQDPLEQPIQHQLVREAFTSRITFTQNDGFYSLPIPYSGSFDVYPPPLTNFISSPTSHNSYFSGINQIDSLNNFAFPPSSLLNDLCVTMTPLNYFRPGYDAAYIVNYENLGTTAIAATVKIFPDNVVSYDSASISPLSISPDSISWNIGTLLPLQSGNFIAIFNVNVGTALGYTCNSVVKIEPIINDVNPGCNIFTATVTITGSFDPNDILVSEDTLTTTQLATQPFLDYTIRFQNTGNDTAFAVKIINPIDTNKLELNSIEFVNSSHPVQLKWVNYNRNMEFLFENILLPDSNINEPQSHGFVKYRIKPKTSLLAGDSVTNKGYIYFDFNAPVETNTATTKIILPTSINELTKGSGQLTLFPNPAKDELNIQLNQPNKINQPITIYVYDVLGNLMRREVTTNTNSQIRNLQSLPSSIYFVEVKTGKEVYRGKFVKE